MFIKTLMTAMAILTLAGCATSAEVQALRAKREARDPNNHVIYYSGSTGDYLLSTEGLCGIRQRFGQCP